MTTPPLHPLPPVSAGVSTPTEVAAFFDLDHTIVRGNTGAMFMRDMVKTGDLSISRIPKLAWVLACYKFAAIDMARVLDDSARMFRNTLEMDMRLRCERLVEESVSPFVSTAAREAIKAHQRLGHAVVLLTAQTQYIAEPVCRRLGIEHWLGTRLSVSGGLLTGLLEGPACYGAGKVTWAKDFSKRHGIRLEASYFYTDSYSDLPMLEKVREPRVVNPDPRLRAEANRRGWTVLRCERK